MTRLEKLREQIKTDEGLIGALLYYSSIIEWDCGRPVEQCYDCKYRSWDDYDECEDCYNMVEAKEGLLEPGFVCTRKTEREDLIEYLNKEVES